MPELPTGWSPFPPALPPIGSPSPASAQAQAEAREGASVLTFETEVRPPSQGFEMNLAPTPARPQAAEAGEADLDGAAVRVQARQRGRNARKAPARKGPAQRTAEADLDGAAVRVQARQRGRLARKGPAAAAASLLRGEAAAAAASAELEVEAGETYSDDEAGGGGYSEDEAGGGYSEDEDQ